MHTHPTLRLASTCPITDYSRLRNWMRQISVQILGKRRLSYFVLLAVVGFILTAQRSQVEMDGRYLITANSHVSNAVKRRDCTIVTSLCSSGRYAHSNQVIALQRTLVYTMYFTSCRLKLPNFCMHEWSTEDVQIQNYYHILSPILTPHLILNDTNPPEVPCFLDDISSTYETNSRYPTSFLCSSIHAFSSKTKLPKQDIVAIPFAWRIPVIFDKDLRTTASAPLNLVKELIGLQPWLLNLIQKVKFQILGDKPYIAAHIRIGDMIGSCPRFFAEGRTRKCSVNKTLLVPFLLSYAVPNTTFVIGTDATPLEVEEMLHDLHRNASFPLNIIIWRNATSTPVIQQLYRDSHNHSDASLMKHMGMLDMIVDSAVYGCADKLLSTFYSTFSSQSRVLPWQICPDQVNRHQVPFFLPALEKPPEASSHL
jgi:hypothetical protein